MNPEPIRTLALSYGLAGLCAAGLLAVGAPALAAGAALWIGGAAIALAVSAIRSALTRPDRAAQPDAGGDAVALQAFEADRAAERQAERQAEGRDGAPARDIA